MDLNIITWLSLVCTVVSGFNLDTSFPIIYTSKAGDYFGFTVALHKNREGSLVLVGAPRANSSVLLDQVHQPGVLFKCNIPMNNEIPQCSEITLYTQGNIKTLNGSEFSYYDRKDDMWLGVSLDIQQNTLNNHIVTCGHLWRNQYFRSHHLPNGVCYVIDKDLDQTSVKKLLPLINRSKQAVIPPGIYYFAFGQAGTSAAFSEDGKHLLLGAPGIYDWSGSIVSYSENEINSRLSYQNPVIPDPPVGLTVVSYLGYSVTSGKFFNSDDLFYAIGAPRDKSHGRVYIFKALDQKRNELLVHHKKEGTQIGEYFGASLLGIKLNGDGLTDLLVGAPLHSVESGGDEGMVYVYISNTVGLQEYAKLMGNSKPNSRFGTAIANVGDLNQDGYNDVAIGAPYEDAKGAVYIYHGSEYGIKVAYVQRIAAAEIDSKLSGFGIHISRGLDIDGNQYPDMLVGSYASSNAVLFRSRPIIQLFPKLIFSPKQINIKTLDCEFAGQKKICVNISTCLWYSGKHLNITLDFTFQIFVEQLIQTYGILPRGFFASNEEQTARIMEKVTLFIGEETCITHLLYIHPNIKDVITPIQIRFAFDLVKPVNAISYFDRSFPIIDLPVHRNITSSIIFQTGCGSEDMCYSDLVVEATLLGSAENGTLILGVASSLSLSITITNKGEPAYLSELIIFLPVDVPIINQDLCVNSNENDNASLICDLGNPLLKDVEVKIIIKLDVSKIPTDRKSLDIALQARTVSTEISPANNYVHISLSLRAIADIGIIRISSQELIIYEDDKYDLPVQMIHTYTVRNHGPSPLQFIDITLYVPTSFSGPGCKVQFLTLTGLEVDNGKQWTVPAECNENNLDIKNIMSNDQRPKREAFGTSKGNFSKRHFNSSVDVVEPPDDIINDSEEDMSFCRSEKNIDRYNMGTHKTKETIAISCENENVECIAIQCTTSLFTDIKKIAQITVAAQINITVLNDFLGPWYRVELITSGYASIRDSHVELQERHPLVSTIKTVFVHKEPPVSEELPVWIIVVSIGAGILLLLIICILLIRFGFFKRERKEQMQKLLNFETKDYEILDNEQIDKDPQNH